FHVTGVQTCALPIYRRPGAARLPCDQLRAGHVAPHRRLKAARPGFAMPQWLSGSAGRWRLRLHVQPGASRTAVQGEHDGCLKLAVAAPPVDGKANDAILKW